MTVLPYYNFYENGIMTKLLTSIKKASKGLRKMLPIIAGVVLLIGLIKTVTPTSLYAGLFQGRVLADSLIGAGLGSVLTGNAATSYIIGGELMDKGIGLLPVTAFLVSWVTVGLVQLPAESVLGTRFAVLRNVTSFLLAIVVASVTVAIMGVL